MRYPYGRGQGHKSKDRWVSFINNKEHSMYKVVRKFNQNNDNYNTRSQSPDKNNRAARRKAAAKARKATTVRKDR